MARKHIVLGIAAVAVLFLLGLALLGNRGADARAEGAMEPRRSSGAVAFHLTPQGMQDGRLAVEVRVDTHSGDLAKLDLQAATELRVGDAAYAPLEPVRLGGHHARGLLLFDVPQQPRTFEIVIRGVRGTDDLTFRWP